MITESIAGRAPTGTLVRSSGVPGLHDPIPREMRLRLAPKHPAGRHWPFTVALVTRGADGSPVAVHRIFPDRDSLGNATILWALVGPNIAPLRGLPRETAICSFQPATATCSPVPLLCRTLSMGGRDERD